MLWDWTEAERVLHGLGRSGRSTRPTTSRPPSGSCSSRRCEELPEPIRGRSIVMIDGAVQGDPAVLEPLRALGPEIDTFAMVPAPALVRLHQDPEEPMPYVGDTALIDELPAGGDRGAARRSPARAPARRWPCVELRQLGGALRPRDARPRRGRRASTRSSCCSPAAWRWTPTWPRSCAPTPAASRPRSRRGRGAGHYLNFAEDAGRRVADATTPTPARGCGGQGPHRPGQPDPREPRHLDSAPHGPRLRTHRRAPAEVDRQAVDVLRGHGPVGRRRARQRLARRARSARCGCSTTTPSPTWTSSAAARRRSPTCATTGASA